MPTRRAYAIQVNKTRDRKNITSSAVKRVGQISDITTFRAGEIIYTKVIHKSRVKSPPYAADPAPSWDSDQKIWQRRRRLQLWLTPFERTYIQRNNTKQLVYKLHAKLYHPWCTTTINTRVIWYNRNPTRLGTLDCSIANQARQCSRRPHLVALWKEKLEAASSNHSK